MSAQYLHGMLRPGIIIAERNFPGVFLLVLAVAEPIVNHELNPRGCQHVEYGDGLEGVPGQQFETDYAWIGCENRRFVGIRVVQRDIAAKARANAAHSRMFQVVVRAIDGASAEGARTLSF